MEERLDKTETDVKEIKSLLLTHIEKEENVIGTIKTSIEETVNGKLNAQHKILENQNEVMGAFVDKVNKHLETDAEFKERVLPFIIKSEREKEFNKEVKEIGGRAIWWGKVVAAIGVIILAIKGALLGIKWP